MPTLPTGISNNPRGFTLIELAIVVFLLALFAAMTFPMMTGVGQNNLDASARRLAGTVKYLFNEAALEGREYRLIFDLGQSTYKAQRLETDGTLTEADRFGKETRLKGDARFQDILITGMGGRSSGEVTTRIFPVGWMEETIIHLQDDKKRTLTLRIRPFTAEMEVHEGYREF